VELSESNLSNHSLYFINSLLAPVHSYQTHLKYLEDF